MEKALEMIEIKLKKKRNLKMRINKLLGALGNVR